MWFVQVPIFETKSVYNDYTFGHLLTWDDSLSHTLKPLELANLTQYLDMEGGGADNIAMEYSTTHIENNNAYI